MKRTIVSLIFFLVAAGTVLSVKAASFYDLTAGKDYPYSKAKLKCVINGTDSALSGTNVLYGETDTAIAPATELFQDSLGVECIFRIADSAITYEREGKTVSYHIGSNNALVNGKDTSMQEAPRVLRDESGITHLYVPSRITAEALGIGYTWEKATNTVKINCTLASNVINDGSGAPMEFPLYSYIDASDVKVEDNFSIIKNGLHGAETYTRQLIVSIPGENADKYNKKRFFAHCDELVGISVKNDNGKTKFIFDTSVIRACVAEIKDGKLCITFKAPWEVYKKIVVIDPGHGGIDGGAFRDDNIEKNYVFDIAYKNTKDLFAASDIKVYYTRTKDVYLSLYARRMLASEVRADMFISVHLNTSESKNDKGTLICYSKERNNYLMPNGLCSQVLAERLLKNSMEKLGLAKSMYGFWTDKDRPLDVTTLQGMEYVPDESVLTEKDTVFTLKGKKFILIYPTPAALIEVAYITNADDLVKIRDAEFRKNAGKMIFDTVKELFDEYPRANKD